MPQQEGFEKKARFVPGSGLKGQEFKGARELRAGYGILLHKSVIQAFNNELPVLLGQPDETEEAARKRLDENAYIRQIYPDVTIEFIQNGEGYLIGGEISNITVYVHGFPKDWNFQIPGTSTTQKGQQFMLDGKGDGRKVGKE